MYHSVTIASRSKLYVQILEFGQRLWSLPSIIDKVVQPIGKEGCNDLHRGVDAALIGYVKSHDFQVLVFRR